jgi:uncharacterized repeat protein (TIGR01451 family)
VAGTVQFSVDGSSAGIAPANVSSGSASVAYTFTSAGSHAVKAVFTPSDTNFAASADSVGKSVSIVSPVATSLSVTGLPTDSLFENGKPATVRRGESRTVTVKVTAKDGSRPTGTVSIVDKWADGKGSETLGTASVDANGVATIPVRFTHWSGAYTEATDGTYDWFGPMLDDPQVISRDPHSYGKTADQLTISFTPPTAAYAPSSTSQSVVVDQVKPTLTLNAASKTFTAGKSVTVNIRLTSTYDLPSGELNCVLVHGAAATSSIASGLIEVLSQTVIDTTPDKPIEASIVLAPFKDPSGTYQLECSYTILTGITGEWVNGYVGRWTVGTAATAYVQFTATGTASAATTTPVSFIYTTSFGTGGIASAIRPAAAVSDTGASATATATFDAELGAKATATAVLKGGSTTLGPFTCTVQSGKKSTVTCPVSGLAKSTKYTVSVTVQTAPGLAGKKLTGTSEVAAFASDGTKTVLASSKVNVTVPKKTVLSATLTSSQKKLAVNKTSIYTLKVKNAGAVDASNLSSCVTLSAGTKVVTANGAKIHGGTVCWSGITLKHGKTLAKTLTLQVVKKVKQVNVTLRISSPTAANLSLKTAVKVA